MPQRVFSVKHLARLPAHDTCDARFWIAAPAIIDRDDLASSKQLRATAGALTIKLAGVEIAREHEFVVACRVVNHPAQQFLRVLPIASRVEKTDQPFVAFR